MRKSLSVVVILLVILCTMLICTSNVFADESVLYYETTAPLQVYDENTNPLFTIPYTYFFIRNNDTAVAGADNNLYYKISYNGLTDLYVLKSDFENKVSSITKLDVSTPYYNIELIAPQGATTLYKYDKDSSSFLARPQQELVSIDFYGYQKDVNGVYYFYVKPYIEDGNLNACYIKADDVTTSFNEANIAAHPQSKEAIEETRQANAKAAQNNLRRNIFFFLVCALCVFVVVLIYNPFKKKGASHAPSQFTSEDDY